MSTDIVPQQTWDDVVARQDRIAGQHNTYVMFYAIVHSRPDLLAEEKRGRMRMPLPSEHITRMRALTALRQLGYIGETEYSERFAELNSTHGKRCTRCQAGKAIITEGDDILCGDCALGEVIGCLGK